MSKRQIQRHFPTAVWLARQILAEASSLVAGARRAFPRETALSPLTWCMIPLTCLPSGVFGAVLGGVLFEGRLPSYPDLESCVGIGMSAALIFLVPLCVVCRASSGRAVATLLFGDALLLAGTALGFWIFLVRAAGS
jgi:hypothetical protein